MNKEERDFMKACEYFRFNIFGTVNNIFHLLIDEEGMPKTTVIKALLSNATLIFKETFPGLTDRQLIRHFDYYLKTHSVEQDIPVNILSNEAREAIENEVSKNAN